MLSKRPHPVIGRLSELLVSGNRAGFPEAVATSPRSPLDYKIQSPRALKNYDRGGVGLGIVAALEKSGHEHDQILGKYAICCPNSSRAVPIPVNSGKNCQRWTKGRVELEMEVDNLENYTYVTCQGPNNQSYTKVYYDGCEYGKNSNAVTTPKQFQTNSNAVAMPKQFQTRSVNEDIPEYPTSDFLSCCNLCSKNLQGRDIYMYRGEKAFCSPECRSSQIMIEERKEKCRSQASKSADISGSPYTTNNIFSTGIFAI